MLRGYYRYPVLTGVMLTEYRALLAGWSGLSCLPKRPKEMPKRLLTLRDDSGPDTLGMATRSYGVNVWADTAQDAANLAADALAATLTLPGAVAGVKAIREPVGPYEVDDDPAFTFNGSPLFHYYFSFDARVKAVGV
jgi:hypothetical protein